MLQLQFVIDLIMEDGNRLANNVDSRKLRLLNFASNENLNQNHEKCRKQEVFNLKQESIVSEISKGKLEEICVT